MYPSSFRMRTISSFILEEGTSTVSCLESLALRIRLSRSDTGSVIVIPETPYSDCDAMSGEVRRPRPGKAGVAGFLPARLRDPGDLAGQGQFPEADPAQLKFPQVPPRAAAPAAAVVCTNLEFRLLFGLGYQTRPCHIDSSAPSYSAPRSCPRLAKGIPIILKSS